MSPSNVNEKEVRLSPQRAKYRDLAGVAKTGKLSTVDDPLSQYIDEHRSKGYFLLDSLDRLLFSMVMTKYVDQQTGWVLDSGDAFIFFSDPEKPAQRKHKIIEQFALFVYKVFQVRNAEQLRRGRAFSEKMDAFIKDVLGDRAKDMLYLDHLATTPAKQGHGYGTALCNVLTDEADARGLASFLVSSNVEANTGFYNHVGFHTVKEFFVGDDDPTWTKPPVVIAIMVREPSICKM